MRFHITCSLFLVLATSACATEEPTGDEPAAWPCSSQRGDVTSTYEYDAKHRVLLQLDERGGVPIHEIQRTFTGDVETRLEETTYGETLAHDVTVREVNAGKVRRVTFTSTWAIGYVEDWTYDDEGTLRETRAVLDDGRVFTRDIHFSAPGVEVAQQCWNEDENCTLRTRHGTAERWRLELVDGPTPTRHERRFDANGLLVWEELLTGRPDGASDLTMHHEIVRRADGAPLTEVMETASGGREETSYRFACTP